jgi:hypothetical protein
MDKGTIQFALILATFATLFSPVPIAAAFFGGVLVFTILFC